MTQVPARLAFSALLSSALGYLAGDWFVFWQTLVAVFVFTGPKWPHPSVEVLERALLIGAWVGIVNLYIAHRLGR